MHPSTCTRLGPVRTMKTLAQMREEPSVRVLQADLCVVSFGVTGRVEVDVVLLLRGLGPQDDVCTPALLQMTPQALHEVSQLAELRRDCLQGEQFTMRACRCN